MLEKDKLLIEFKKFGDPEYIDFKEFPDSLEDVKEKWSNAFFTYIQDIEVIAPASVEPKNVQAEVILDVKSAFAGEIEFDSSSSVSDTVNNIASAWEKAVLAIKLVPCGEYAGGGTTINKILPFKTITGKADLIKELTGIFSSATPDNLEQMKRITTALHDATILALKTSCVYLNPALAPPTMTGSLIFG